MKRDFLLSILVFGSIILPIYGDNLPNMEGEKAALVANAKKGNIPALVKLHKAGAVFALPQLKEMASAGNSMAQYVVGLIYEEGCNVEKSDVMAERYFKQAANKNLTAAKAKLMQLYFDKNSSLYNQDKAWIIFEEFAEKGNVKAMVMMARFYDCGIHRRQDHNKAADFYKRLAKRESLVGMGYCAEYGIGEPVNTETALAWYADASKQKDPDALYHYARLRLRLDPEAIKDSRVTDALEEASQQKHAGAEYLECIYKKRSWSESLVEAEHLAGATAYAETLILSRETRSQGMKILEMLEVRYNHPDAMALRTCVMIWGVCGNKPDAETHDKGLQLYQKISSRWSEMAPGMVHSFSVVARKIPVAEINGDAILRQAAAMGESAALVECAELDMKSNPAQAVISLKKALENKFPAAYLKLGECYDDGIGVQEDPAHARQLFEEAVKRNNSEDARYRLIKMRAQGRGGFSKDILMADESYRKMVGLDEYTMPQCRVHVSWTIEMAKLGIPAAQYVKGVNFMFFHPDSEGMKELARLGLASPQTDNDKMQKMAMQAWTEAAQNGNPEAAYAMGEFFRVRFDGTQAANSYKLAAELAERLNPQRYEEFIRKAKEMDGFYRGKTVKELCPSGYAPSGYTDMCLQINLIRK